MSQNDSEHIVTNTYVRRIYDPKGLVTLGSIVALMVLTAQVFWGLPAFPEFKGIQVLRCISMFMVAIVAIAFRQLRMKVQYLWITLVIQIIMLCLTPLPLRSDGSLRYVMREDGLLLREITGTHMQFLLLPPGFPFFGITLEVQDLRLHTDQINCRLFPVAVSQAANGCEIDHWTIAVDVPVTTGALDQLPVDLQQDEFVVDVNKRVCRALTDSDEIRALHINRVDVIHDAAAQDAVADLVERALSDLKLHTHKRPRISARMTAHPPADICNP